VLFCSGWGQQQLLTVVLFRVAAAATADCCFAQVFEFGTCKTNKYNWLQKCSTFSCYFVLTLQQKVRNSFFYIRGESVFSAAQFTVPVFLGFTFHKTLDFREKVANLIIIIYLTAQNGPSPGGSGYNTCI
jgi:hypothetical protein